MRRVGELGRTRPRSQQECRIGLLMHQASVTRRLESPIDLLRGLCGARLSARFRTQHGVVADEGTLIRHSYDACVGLYPVPMMHGLTVGEMALLVNARLPEHTLTPLCELAVVPLDFFFSSRRRHTRSDRDWSSDVCSSD